MIDFAGWVTAVVMVEGEVGDADAFRETGEAEAWAAGFVAGASACGGPSMSVLILPRDQAKVPGEERPRREVVDAWREAVMRNRKRVGD